MTGCLSVSSLFTATMCCYNYTLNRGVRGSVHTTLIPPSFSVSTHVPSNQSLQCISFFSLIIWHLENILHVDKGYCFPWVMMLWHTIPVGIKRYVCPNRLVLFHLCQAFSTIQRKKHLPGHCCIAFLSFTLILSQQILNTSRRCSSTMKTTCLLYILLNTTFLSSEIFGYRFVSVDLLLASVRNRQT